MKQFCAIVIIFLVAPYFSNSQNVDTTITESKSLSENYFYYGYDYGTQAIYNPVYVMLNRGYDILQIQYNHRNIFDFNYSLNSNNVLRSFAHPFKNIKELGWNEFLFTEILPTKFSLEGRWVPNYFLHLLGGGSTYKTMEEWFVFNNYKHPKIWSSAVIMLSAYLNETLENNDATEGKNTDAIADFFIFDIGGILLFNLEKVSGFFSKKVVFADWSLQPSFTLPNFYLHNHGQHYSIKIKLPYIERIKFFSYIGLESFYGASFKLKNQNSLSIGGGLAASRLIQYSDNPNQNTILTRTGIGIFYDRNNSLLASVVVGDVVDYFIHLNVYPGVVKFGNFSPGFWTVISRKGQMAFGIATTFTLGFGAGYDFIDKL
ncbi:hypothetical protein ACFLQ9_00045 [Bacteroidota bacterium]